MPKPPRRFPEIVQSVLAQRGLQVAPEPTNRQPAGSDSSQLVFVGNWQDPCPRRLLFDPGLEPVDIVTWQVMRIHADPRQMTAFPAYPELMRAIRVSRATIARALAVLRLTRWLPLCTALRDTEGRFAGHVYALNDEPLPLAETLGVDGGYVRFVEQACGHRSAHVRRLAQGTLETLRADAIAPVGAAFEPIRVAAHVAGRLDEMLSGFGDRVQNLNAANPVQNLNAVRSSSDLYKNTTTTLTPSDADERGDVASEPALLFPDALVLTDSQRRVLALRLQALPATVRQDILDEAAGRVTAKRKTVDPVRCQFDYIARLCTKAIAGQFVLTDAGGRVRARRQDSAATEARLQRAREASDAKRLEEIARHRARSDEGK
jgi:hypothetical protein